MEIIAVGIGAFLVWQFVVSPMMKRAQEAKEVRQNAHIYEYEDAHREFRLDFAAMRLHKPSLRDAMLSSGVADGEAIMDARDIPEVLEVRRLDANVWETRLDHDTWKAFRELTIKKANEDLADPSFGFDSDEFEELTGTKHEEWIAWQKSDRKGERPKAVDPPDARQWKKVADQFAPAIETAYQRYLGGQPATPRRQI